MTDDPLPLPKHLAAAYVWQMRHHGPDPAHLCAQQIAAADLHAKVKDLQAILTRGGLPLSSGVSGPDHISRVHLTFLMRVLALKVTEPSRG